MTEISRTHQRMPWAFDARLPDVTTPVRISSFFDAQVFVRRWAIRDKDPAIRRLRRRLERPTSMLVANVLIEEFKRELAQRGLLPAAAG
jgi:hypothetical protein